MQIREDARWRTDRDGARLELYTENESHVGLIAVREWCTYAADGEAPHTRARKSLHITARMVLRPWWLLGAERKLEAFLVRRWLHALQLGLAADDALCAEVLAERAAVDEGLMDLVADRADSRARSHGNYLPALDCVLDILRPDADR